MFLYVLGDRVKVMTNLINRVPHFKKIMPLLGERVSPDAFY